MKDATFQTIEPKILYFGTPVSLITSINEDGSTNIAPELKAKQFSYEKNKFEAGDFTPLASDMVKPSRVAECPMHLEARVRHLHPMGGTKLEELGGGVAAEVEIIRIHANDEFVKDGKHIDPQKWSPLIYNFRHYFRLAEDELGKTFRA